MSDLAIETSGLRKVYLSAGRRTVALDGLDLQVRTGEVHGFLGPNGSGKTTTIRMVVGLARPTRGELRVLGQALPGGLPAVMDRVGALVEQPRFAPTFSGRKNLLLLARTAGRRRSDVDRALERVGLRDRAKVDVADYSLGMKQRLAIAAALLKDPDLLVLDEPTNGLDPAGIRQIRDLIAQLGEAGTTVLLSSHILTEVQQLCHSVSILGEGRLLASGRVTDLLDAHTVARSRVVVADLRGAQHVLETAGCQVTREEESLLVEGREHPEDITRLLAERGVYVREIQPVRPTLESFFLRLTARRSGTDGTGVAAASTTPEEGGAGEQAGEPAERREEGA